MAAADKKNGNVSSWTSSSRNSFLSSWSIIQTEYFKLNFQYKSAAMLRFCIFLYFTIK